MRLCGEGGRGTPPVSSAGTPGATLNAWRFLLLLGVLGGGFGGLLVHLSEDGVDAVADRFAAGSSDGASGGDGAEFGQVLGEGECD